MFDLAALYSQVLPSTSQLDTHNDTEATVHTALHVFAKVQNALTVFHPCLKKYLF